jgi:sugar-phosphatase
MMPSFKALIFDLDGTLVDSSEVVRQVMETWCLKNGIPLQSVLDVCHGGRTEDTVSLVAPYLCAQAEAAQIEYLESTTLEGLMPIPGADLFLASLPPDMWAIVTSSSMLTAKPKLAACRMPVPRVFITAESVNSGKPPPEPFLKAAQELEIEPEDCLVFEDADNGVRSALTAGCKVIVVGHSCKIQHANIISRMGSFAEIGFAEAGDLRIGAETIATRTQMPNKTDAGNGSYAICRVIDASGSPSPDPGGSALIP